MAADDERYLPPPPKRSILARILALLALVGTILVLYVVISGSTGDEEPADSGAKAEKTQPKEGPETPKEYTVQEGESISGIAEKYGISVERIERLNPDLDPNTLATGVVIKLQK